MNFFERQAQARRTSTRLLVLFALAVAGIVLAAVFAVWVVAGTRPDGSPNVSLLLMTALVALAVIGFGSLYRMASLRDGGEAVALQLGGVPVAEDTADLDLRRLRNVVEEIAIASGVPMPQLYVLEHESSINAFAAGYAPSDAAIAVTRGALDRLNRDELQGVVAHEFSHVLNGDMRLNIRLIGVLFGILMLGLIGRKVLQHAGRARGRGVAAVLAAALVAMVIGYIGLFFGRLIKAGISRTRESLADASAVQFTRQTTGLAGALKKIAGLPEGSLLRDRGDAEEVSHMLFGDGTGLSGLFATHPPLLQRIQALEPSFDAGQLDSLSRRWMQRTPHGLEEDRALGLDQHAGSLPLAAASLLLEPTVVSAQVARPEADDYRRADAIVAALPDALHAQAVSRDSAMPLLLALLLDGEPPVRALQVEEIAARLGTEAANRARRLRDEALDGLHPQLRLPLAELAFPALRRRPRPQLDAFLDTVHAMVHADGRVALFEYCLGRLLQSQVREALDPAAHARFGRRRLSQVRSELATLLCVVAQHGHADQGAAQRAYLAGMQRILPQDHLPYLPRQPWTLALDGVWEPLDALDPLAKQVLVEAVTATVSHDGRVSVAESELLRTLCGVLHCPLPPMLERA
jgi:Zn-dependent protease with chaperone function